MEVLCLGSINDLRITACFHVTRSIVMHLGVIAGIKACVSSAGPPLGVGTAHFRLVLEDAVTDFNKIQRVMQHMAASGANQKTFTETQLRSQVCSCSPTKLCYIL